MNFEILGLKEQLLRAVHAAGYTRPTPIQEQAIPVILEGVDVMGAAQTGTGKTAGFTLPLLQRLDQKTALKKKSIRALVLTPTRELAAQVQDSVLTYGKYLQFSCSAIFGGVGINPQITKLRRGVDILVATPGRLLDLYQQNAVRFDSVEILVLDEADRMLDMGFLADIKRIIALLPEQRQNLMFSATFSKEIRQLARTITNDPVEIQVDQSNATVKAIKQIVHPVDKARKAKLLSHLIRTENWFQVLIFTRTKHGADKLVKQLKQNDIHAAAIHGNKSQAQRTEVMNRFKQNKIQVLVATDIASRGIDVDQLTHVVNYDLPNSPEDYIHRIGRTGRAGAGGNAVSLVSADEIKQLRDIERFIKYRINSEEIEGFKPGQQAAGPISDAPAPQKAGPEKTRHRNGKRMVSDRQQARGKFHKQKNSGKKNNKSGPRVRHSGGEPAFAF